MKIILRHKYLSRPRYNRYLNATRSDLSKAKRLYNGNIRLAQAFHPLFTQFEVVLRNAIQHVLAIHFRDIDWIINEKNGFMSNPSLSNSRYFLKDSVSKSEQKLRRRNKVTTSGKILSDQTFGFWTAFFLAHHYSLLAGSPIHAFPYKPRNENRASIYKKLEMIKDFRNRINHCEPICFDNNQTSLAKAEEVYKTLFDLIAWIDPAILVFFNDIDNVKSKMKLIKKI